MRALSENEASQQLQPVVEQHLLIFSVIEALWRQFSTFTESIASSQPTSDRNP
jgi:hypothetical protein